MKAKLFRRISKLKFELLLFCTWGIYFIALFSRMMSIRPDGLYVGHEVIWSDWASLHLGMANIFATKPPSLWFAYHTVFADGQLTYAFLTNLISALFMRNGCSVPFSFLFPSVVFSLVLIFAMFRVFTQLLNSKPQAFVGIFIFLLAGGLGFVDYLSDFFSNKPSGLFLFINHAYSAIPSRDWLAGNYIWGHLLPQRAFLLGMPLALLGLAGLLQVLLSPKNDFRFARTVLILSGVFVGLLPVAHMHSLIALVIVLTPVVLVSWREWRKLLCFVAPAGVLSVLLYFLFIHGGIKKSGFMSIVPGFGAKSFSDWLWFWFKAWSVQIPLAVIGLVCIWTESSKHIRALFLGFFLIFALANLIQFQPTRWDNSKLFVWSYLGLSALSARALFVLWKGACAWKGAALALGVAMTFTGVLETLDLQRVEKHTYRLLSREEMDLAEEVRLKTHPLARFATAFTHDHPIAVWGARPVLLGYRSWVENYGFIYDEIERDIRAIYRGEANAPELIKKHRISYVFIGPQEQREFQPNEGYFKRRFPVAFQANSGNERVYDVR